MLRGDDILCLYHFISFTSFPFRSSCLHAFDFLPRVSSLLSHGQTGEGMPFHPGIHRGDQSEIRSHRRSTLWRVGFLNWTVQKLGLDICLLASLLDFTPSRLLPYKEDWQILRLSDWKGREATLTFYIAAIVSRSISLSEETVSHIRERCVLVLISGNLRWERRSAS